MVTTAVAVLLLGLITVQVYWVRNAYRSRQEHFSRQVNAVLARVAAYSNDELYSFYLYGRSYINPGEGVMMLKADYKSRQITDTVSLFNAFAYNNENNDSCFYATNISYYDRLTLVDVSMKFTYKLDDTTLDVPEKNKEFKQLTLANVRTRLDNPLPVIKRLPPAKLDSVFAVALRQEHIQGAYVFGLRKKCADSFDYTYGRLAPSLLDATKFSIQILSDIPFATPYELVLHIDNRDKFISRSLMSALGISFMIILLLVAAFIYFAYTVLKQKKLSEMKTDFINNMTHEFMTPVTNIALALETLERKYDANVLDIIGTENNLLKDNIHKVLQVAVLEKGSYLLDSTDTDIHNLLKRVVRNFSPQVQEKNGKIVFDLKAANPRVIADETHIINLFYNLVDNAVKYSGKTAPLITIGTVNEKGKLKVTVRDNGMGMPPGVKEMIFEKFYRGQKGDRHDVKGFGLGLTYVKSIAAAHGIIIHVDSKEGEGTVFTLWFKQ